MNSRAEHRSASLVILGLVFASGGILSGCIEWGVWFDGNNERIETAIDDQALDYLYLNPDKKPRIATALAGVPARYRGVTGLLGSKDEIPTTPESTVLTANLLDVEKGETVEAKRISLRAFRLRAEVTHRAGWLARLISFRAGELAALDEASDRQKRLDETRERLRDIVSRETPPPETEDDAREENRTPDSDEK